MKLEEYYDLVDDIITKDEFLEKIKKQKKEFENLLDDLAIAHRIVDELDRNPGNHYKINELEDNTNASISGEIVKIHQMIEKPERNLKLLKIDISDGTKKCTITLWNEDAVKYSNLKEKNEITIINGYVKIDRYGLQITPGKWGEIILNDN